MKTTIQSILIVVTLLFLGLLAQVQALTPSPDGCYPNFTTAEGCDALNFLSTGAGNTGLGWRSLFLDSTGSFNTGVGGGALALNNADSNTAVGAAALLLNTTGTLNVAVGTDALVFNDSGSRNNAIGAFALFNNIDGSFNNAFGNGALLENIHAGGNTAIGDQALQNNDVTGNTSANDNTAVGGGALQSNTDGAENTAIGQAALQSNSNANFNTAVGTIALLENTAGAQNTAVGRRALFHSTGDNNTALGHNAGQNVTTASNVICIGANVPGADVSNTCFIGNIFGATASGGSAVFINSSGQLGTLTSSRRFKEGIKPMHGASEGLFDLKPVAFRYKKEIDPVGTSQFGLVAEEVEKVNPDLVVRDKEGKPYSVRYEMVNAMLLNEFLKEHRKVEEQQAAIAELKSVVARQQKQFEAAMAEQRKQFEARLEQQDANIQRVSAQLELNALSRRTASNNE